MWSKSRGRSGAESPPECDGGGNILARWSRTLSTLISSGVDIIKALEITAQTSGNWVVEHETAIIRHRVEMLHHGPRDTGAVRVVARIQHFPRHHVIELRQPARR